VKHSTASGKLKASRETVPRDIESVGEKHPHPHPFFVRADSKGVTDEVPVRADSKGVTCACCVALRKLLNLIYLRWIGFASSIVHTRMIVNGSAASVRGTLLSRRQSTLEAVE
jgi:hypothetical protein